MRRSMRLHRLHQHRYRRRGATILIVAVMMPVLLGFMALAIDVGTIYSMDAETQNAADMAALAGVSALATGDQSAAVQRCNAFLDSNCLSTTRAANTATIELGRW